MRLLRVMSYQYALGVAPFPARPAAIIKPTHYPKAALSRCAAYHPLRVKRRSSGAAELGPVTPNNGRCRTAAARPKSANSGLIRPSMSASTSSGVTSRIAECTMHRPLGSAWPQGLACASSHTVPCTRVALPMSHRIDLDQIRAAGVDQLPFRRMGSNSEVRGHD